MRYSDLIMGDPLKLQIDLTAARVRWQKEYEEMKRRKAEKTLIT